MRQQLIHHTKWLITAFLATVAIIQIQSCNSDTSGPTPLTTISMSDMRYNPTTLIVSKGTTVTWKNNGIVEHTATADNGSWNTADIEPGESKSITFDQVGSYPYHCIYHENMGMKGTIVVQ